MEYMEEVEWTEVFTENKDVDLQVQLFGAGHLWAIDRRFETGTQYVGVFANFDDLRFRIFVNDHGRL